MGERSTRKIFTAIQGYRCTSFSSLLPWAALMKQILEYGTIIQYVWECRKPNDICRCLITLIRHFIRANFHSSSSLLSFPLSLQSHLTISLPFLLYMDHRIAYVNTNRSLTGPYTASLQSKLNDGFLHNREYSTCDRDGFNTSLLRNVCLQLSAAWACANCGSNWRRVLCIARCCWGAWSTVLRWCRRRTATLLLHCWLCQRRTATAWRLSIT